MKRLRLLGLAVCLLIPAVVFGLVIKQRPKFFPYSGVWVYSRPLKVSDLLCYIEFDKQGICTTDYRSGGYMQKNVPVEYSMEGDVAVIKYRFFNWNTNEKYDSYVYEGRLTPQGNGEALVVDLQKITYCKAGQEVETRELRNPKVTYVRLRNEEAPDLTR